MDFFQRLITALTVTHPIHAMLVHFPIGFTAAGLLFILLALWRKDELFEKIAYANMVISAISVLPAAASGIYDNQINFLGDAPNANVKIMLGTLLLLITVGTSLWRRKHEDLFTRKSARFFYVSAYILSFTLAMVLGFLGGVIVYGF
ncbi:MAG: DUF2231 domain-containing protein [Chloroflexota bacterium]